MYLCLAIFKNQIKWYVIKLKGQIHVLLTAWVSATRNLHKICSSILNNNNNYVTFIVTKSLKPSSEAHQYKKG